MAENREEKEEEEHRQLHNTLRFTQRQKSPAKINLFKVKNQNTRKSCEICLKSTIKPPERRQLVLLLLIFNILDTFFKCFY